MEKQQLIDLAFQARENSYSPYSNFKVGACVECKDGKYFFGANIENAAYGSTICAERNAVFGAYCNGYKKDDIVAIAIVTKAKSISYCCGSCRQVISELVNKDVPIHFSNGVETVTKTVAELLPYSFDTEDLAQ